MAALPGSKIHLSDFLRYLATRCDDSSDRLPPLTDLSRELGISVTTLREQLEVARSFGWVEVRPKTGMRRLPYAFSPAIRQSLAYAMSLSPRYFEQFADLRAHLESAYWFEAVSKLEPDDVAYLKNLVATAQAKLNTTPPQLPHAEHRELHLTIYRRLNQPFVIGLLEAYWDMYESAGLDVYLDLSYLNRVWYYHQKMVECIAAGGYEAGYQAFREHVQLIGQRNRPQPNQKFE